jgi:hypothetical protein
MIFAEGPPNLMQRLPRLPTPPHVGSLLLRKLEPPSKCHKHHLIEKDLYQMVLHRPVEPAGVIRTWRESFRGMWSEDYLRFADHPNNAQYNRVLAVLIHTIC